MKRVDRTRILVHCDNEFIHHWANQFASLTTVETISKPEHSLVMVKMRESAQQSLFYLTEVLVSQARVKMNNSIGLGIVQGNDLDKAYDLAIIDAGYMQDSELNKSFIEALLQQKALQDIKARKETTSIMKTKVSFETMDI